MKKKRYSFKFDWDGEIVGPFEIRYLRETPGKFGFLIEIEEKIDYGRLWNFLAHRENPREAIIETATIYDAEEIRLFHKVSFQSIDFCDLDESETGPLMVEFECSYSTSEYALAGISNSA